MSARHHVSTAWPQSAHFGVATTAIYATSKDWALVVPTIAWAGGFGAALLIGAIAGLMPALRAAKMSPTQALWSL